MIDVYLFVCLYVCLFVSNITQTVTDRMLCRINKLGRGLRSPSAFLVFVIFQFDMLKYLPVFIIRCILSLYNNNSFATMCGAIRKNYPLFGTQLLRLYLGHLWGNQCSLQTPQHIALQLWISVEESINSVSVSYDPVFIRLCQI